MRTRESQKVYNNATNAVCDSLFDMTASGSHIFLSCFTRRANAFGWTKTTGILSIPENTADPYSPKENFLYTYGSISRDQVLDFAFTYIFAKTRNAQDDVMLFECIMKSLTASTIRKLSLCTNDYKVHDQPCGILLLKLVISEARIDSNATAAMARLALSSLDKHMRTLPDHNILTFNNFVRE